MKTEWVDCPICGSCDTEKTTETDSGGESHSLIFCTNHACASNGGSNKDALQTPPTKIFTAAVLNCPDCGAELSVKLDFLRHKN